MDGNGDGIGDFEGLRGRLDYLQSLGVDVLWLAPMYPTPNRDDGYDISDYYGVDGRLGTSGDFAELLFEADGRGIRVLLDLVVNHSSSRHPWFQSARGGEEIQRIITYWLRLGVSGFRVDAVPFLLEKPQPEGGRPQLHFEYLRELR